MPIYYDMNKIEQILPPPLPNSEFSIERSQRRKNIYHRLNGIHTHRVSLQTLYHDFRRKTMKMGQIPVENRKEVSSNKSYITIFTV